MVRSYGDYTTNLLLELVRPFVSDCAVKERIVREVGYGLSLGGASAAELVNSKQAKIA